MIEKIVTFSCNSSVHIYKKGCSEYPKTPYKTHDSINNAINYLIDCGKKNIKLTIYDKRTNDSHRND